MFLPPHPLFSCLRFHPRVVLSACVIVLLLIPVPLRAEEQILLLFEDKRPVSRADFIGTAMPALSVELMQDQKKLPFRNIPASIMQEVQTAHELGAMRGWSPDRPFTAPVTRGEAVEFLIILSNLEREKPNKPAAFKDVRPETSRGRAIAVAVERGWIKPVRPGFFGERKPLLGRDARELLAKASGRELRQIPAIRVRIVPPEKKETKKTFPSQEALETIWNFITSSYLYKEKIKEDEAGYKAIEGLVQSLNDPYTSYLRPVSAKNFQSQLEGEVTGIGAQVEQKNGAIIIISPLAGSPAEQAGLQPGDQITAVDGTSLAGVGFEDAVNRIRGKKGTPVILRISRGGSEFDITIVRDTIRVPEVEISWQGDIAIVKLIQFGQTTDRQLRGAMEGIQKKRPSGMVLDLRSNPGGLLHAAGTVLSNFLPKGSVFATISTKDETKEERTEEEPTIGPDVKLVVIVNKGSASASEIVAGVLQETGRARVIGEKTYGKGTVQQVWKLSDGSSFKMTIAEWKTPGGRKIDGVGVEPDELVEKGSRDEQLLRAIQILR